MKTQNTIEQPTAYPVSGNGTPTLLIFSDELQMNRKSFFPNKLMNMPTPQKVTINGQRSLKYVQKN